jgi:hypothetical protein
LEEQIAAAGNTRCVSSPLGTLSHVLVKVGGRVRVFL